MRIAAAALYPYYTLIIPLRFTVEATARQCKNNVREDESEVCPHLPGGCPAEDEHESKGGERALPAVHGEYLGEVDLRDGEGVHEHCRRGDAEAPRDFGSFEFGLEIQVEMRV